MMILLNTNMMVLVFQNVPEENIQKVMDKRFVNVWIITLAKIALPKTTKINYVQYAMIWMVKVKHITLKMKKKVILIKIVIMLKLNLIIILLIQLIQY